VAVGLLGALTLTRFLESLLFGVGATDPLTFLVVPAILLGVALVACGVPALRGVRVQPVTALRHE
jgi:putative ABC transport system permease protein